MYEDSRLQYLSIDFFKDKKCLDIGCNAGYTTIEIAKLKFPSSILGIDIDNNLIIKARKILKSYIDSAIGEADVSSFPNNVLFKTEDFINQNHLGKDYEVITWY